jgi:hypothetical protein
MRDFDILRSTNMELLNLIKGDSINDCDFLNFIIPHSDSHCGYSPPEPKPSNTIGCAFLHPAHRKMVLLFEFCIAAVLGDYLRNCGIKFCEYIMTKRFKSSGLLRRVEW